MWTKKDSGKNIVWGGARDYCQRLQLAGYSDWRLPTIDELQSIYDPIANVHKVHVKGNLQLSSGSWSSSEGKTPVEAFTFNFLNGKRQSFATADSSFGPFRAL